MLCDVVVENTISAPSSLAERLGSDTANPRRGKYDRSPRAVICIRLVRPWWYVQDVCHGWVDVTEGGALVR